MGEERGVLRLVDIGPDETKPIWIYLNMYHIGVLRRGSILCLGYFCFLWDGRRFW